MLKTFPKGGIHPDDNKLTGNKAIEKLVIPKIVMIPVTQHLGAPATPVVKPGDKVKTGQLIAKSSSFISANVHSSVSGSVKKIENVTDTSGYKKEAIIIETEGDEWIETIDRDQNLKKDISLSREEILARIENAGIVGMGGATFPTHIKLNVPAGKKAEFILINGVECEPFLTCDHRLMLEKSEELLVGIQILMKILDVKKVIIGIENNKPDVIEKLSGLVLHYNGIQVCPVKMKYPQGGEKQLIQALIKRQVPSGGIPVDIGAVVFNVASVFAIYEAVQKNKPLIERVVTVTGKSVKNPSNYLVRIGTPIIELVEAAGGMPKTTGKIINGGPMMGKSMSNLDVPVMKGCSGVLLLDEKESKRKEMQSCIRCARCVGVCPIGLEPYLLMALAERSVFDKLENEKVTDCVECGSCSYTCPANRPLLDYIRFGKSSVLKIIRSRKK